MRCPRIAYNAFQRDFTLVVYATQCVTIKKRVFMANHWSLFLLVGSQIVGKTRK